MTIFKNSVSSRQSFQNKIKFKNKYFLFLVQLQAQILKIPSTFCTMPKGNCKVGYGKNSTQRSQVAMELQLKGNHCNKGSFCNNSEIDTLNSERLSVENKAKFSQLEILNNLSMLVERVSLCFLQIITFKLVCQFRYCYKTCPC